MEKNLDELLFELRESIEEKQSEVAENTDVSSPSLSYYERGERTPPYKTLIELLDHYGAHLAIESQEGKWKFQVKEGEISFREVKETESLDIFTGLDKQEKEDLIAYIRRRKNHQK